MPTTVQKPARGTARDRLIRTGVELCTQGGFQAMGIEQVLSQSGVPKGSFYHYFRSKKEFGLAVIDAYAVYFCKKLQRVLTNAEESPLTRLRSFVDEACDGMSRHEFQRGCLVGNLGQEMAALDNEFRNQLENVLKLWEAQTARCLEEAQAAGELQPSHDVERLAEFFWIGWEGAILRAKLTRSPRPMRLFAEEYLVRLNT
ncbi:MAG TPA: TetR/AcrR family transcriptional regulator [Burkholderiaceae bacterium]|nr:TetR/AcrR family transcriptional regulator [Burkholderiaceae bacterium]